MQVQGMVVRGEGKASRYYHLPTANIGLTEPLQLDYGAYCAQVRLPNRETIPGIVCWSAPGNHLQKFEVHLFGFSGDLYGQELMVEVLEKVSELAPFTSEQQMRQKIWDDVSKAKQMLKVK